MNKISILAGVLALSLALAGCSTPMRPSEQGAVVGTVGGAAAGGIIGAMAGNAGMGAAIGAGTGLVGGYLYGKHKEAEQDAYNRGRADGARGY